MTKELFVVFVAEEIPFNIEWTFVTPGVPGVHSQYPSVSFEKSIIKRDERIFLNLNTR